MTEQKDKSQFWLAIAGLIIATVSVIVTVVIYFASKKEPHLGFTTSFESETHVIGQVFRQAVSSFKVKIENDGSAPSQDIVVRLLGPENHWWINIEGATDLRYVFPDGKEQIIGPKLYEIGQQPRNITLKLSKLAPHTSINLTAQVVHRLEHPGAEPSIEVLDDAGIADHKAR